MAEWSKEVFAANLKRYMDSRDINQKELAEIVNVSTASVNDWVKAKKFPRIDKIEIMADYFGILKSDLIEDKEKEKPTEDDGLSENIKALMDFAKTVPEDKAELVLKLMRTIVEDD